MRKIQNIIKHYIKESLDSLFIDQVVSLAFAALVTWIFKDNLQVIDDKTVPSHIKFLILGVAFFIVYTISVVMQLRPHRYKFRIRSLDVIVEYLGDVVNIYSTYNFTTNRIRVNKMYTRKTWFSDEKFKIKVQSEGYTIEKIRQTGNDYEYYVVFPRPQHFWNWKPNTYKIFLHGTNKRRQFENFYWYDVITPTDKITIEVRIPREYCNDKIVLKSFLDHEDSVGSTEETKDYNGVYKWEIPNPTLGWSYKFEWNWSRKELELKKRK